MKIAKCRFQLQKSLKDLLKLENFSKMFLKAYFKSGNKNFFQEPKLYENQSFVQEPKPYENQSFLQRSQNFMKIFEPCNFQNKHCH